MTKQFFKKNYLVQSHVQTNIIVTLQALSFLDWAVPVTLPG